MEDNEIYFKRDFKENEIYNRTIYRYKINENEISIISEENSTSSLQKYKIYQSKEILAIYTSEKRIITIFVKNESKILYLKNVEVKKFIIDDLNWRNFAFISENGEVFYIFIDLFV